MTFNTYYWHGYPLEDPALEDARGELAAPPDRETYTRAFLTLLRSHRTAAIGTALDHYDYAESSSRHGAGNPFSDYSAEALEKARYLLRQPPLPATEAGAGEDGVNHASALGAMLNLAQGEDAELIASALEQATGPSARAAGLLSARTALERADSGNPRLVTTLGNIVFDDTCATRERIAALRALGGSGSQQASDLVLRAAELDDLEIQVHAAFVLANRDPDRHREVLERMMAAWPNDPPYPGSEVIDLLHEDDEV